MVVFSFFRQRSKCSRNSKCNPLFIVALSNKCQKQPPEAFYKKNVLRNFTKFAGKHLCQSLFFKRGLRPTTLFKKRLWHRCFPVNFTKFRTPFLQNTFSGCFRSAIRMSSKRGILRNMIQSVVIKECKMNSINCTEKSLESVARQNTLWA